MIMKLCRIISRFPDILFPLSRYCFRCALHLPFILLLCLVGFTFTTCDTVSILWQRCCVRSVFLLLCMLVSFHSFLLLSLFLSLSLSFLFSSLALLSFSFAFLYFFFFVLFLFFSTKCYFHSCLFKYLRLINKYGSEGLRARKAFQEATTTKIASHKTASPIAFVARHRSNVCSPSGPGAAVSSKYIKYIIQFIRLKSPLSPLTSDRRAQRKKLRAVPF